MRIVLLGSSGYIGSAFLREMHARNLDFDCCSIRANDRMEKLKKVITLKTALVINCAAFIPPTSVAECDNAPGPTVEGNVILPANLAAVCAYNDVPLVHLSTGCMWNDGQEHVECDLPSRAFDGPCGFYVGIKALAERAVSQWHKHYILRIRLPFDEFAHPRNYLSKLAGFSEVYDHTNSLTHRGDFVKVALDLVEMGAPYGTYNCTNPGSADAVEILDMMMAAGIANSPKINVIDGPKTDCKLNVQKLLSTGVKMRDVNEALGDALRNWKPAHV